MKTNEEEEDKNHNHRSSARESVEAAAENHKLQMMDKEEEEEEMRRKVKQHSIVSAFVLPIIGDLHSTRRRANKSRVELIEVAADGRWKRRFLSLSDDSNGITK